MKISARFYPAIILITFTAFVLIGLLLGFRPQHDSGKGRGGFVPAAPYVLVEMQRSG